MSKTIEITTEALHTSYDGIVSAKVKVHENANGEFFENIVFEWLDAPTGSNSRFALVTKGYGTDEPFMFAVASVLSATPMLKGPVIKFETGDLLTIEGVGDFTIEEGEFLSHGVKLLAA